MIFLSLKRFAMRWLWTNHPAKMETLNSKCAAATALADFCAARQAVLGFAAAAGAQARRKPAGAGGRGG